ncbi:MAG: flagellar brake domain-containing protein [Lachnospiraceae bacterium]|nr:flagellar brake domain-containing protein [Lachnospiraceae bacterium]
MLKNVLKVGDRIELKSTNRPKNPDDSPKVYMSQVLDILDDYRMNIAVPIESGHLVPLEIGSRYEMSFLTNSGLYMCKCEIKNRLKQENLYYLAINIISELKRDQRRQYFRLEKIIPLKYRVISDLELRLRYFMEKKAYKDDREKRIVTEKLMQLEGVIMDGTIVNVSGGGIKFSSLAKHENGTTINIDFWLDEDIEIEAEAKIIGTAEIANSKGLVEYRCEFKKIKKDIREKIVRYVFSEERKQRQKENGLQ